MIINGDFMKILVVFTGGTIGSSVSDGWISPDDSMKYRLISEFYKNSDTEVEFETVVPYTILSENLSAENLNMLIDCVNKNKDCFDGIIVTHGTDSLQYSAAALAFALGNYVIPTVLVSSNYPLEDKRANGLHNFIAAVEFIKSGAGRGVFVSYKNKNNPAEIHLATRIVCHTEASDEVCSIDGNPVAFYDGKITVNPEFRFTYCGAPVTDAHFSNNSQILSVSAMPGDDFQYNISSYKAVILRPYHSGTLNTANDAFVSFCKQAKNRNIPVFAVNVPGGTTYESSKEYENLGITVLPMCSFVSVYIKTWLAISTHKNIPDFVKTPLYCEFL